MAENLVKTTQYTAPGKNILIAPEVAVAIPVMVNNTGVIADADGRKIIKAGTPVGGAVSALTTRSTVLSVTNTSTLGSNSQGLLLHDVDVTNGEVSTQLLIFGFVDSSKIPSLDSTVITALSKITFINGGAY